MSEVAKRETFFMACQKCGKEFPEPQIDISHDIPQYMGGTDSDGRHNLCEKCHDIYEGIAFSVFFRAMPEEQKTRGKEAVKNYAKKYFRRKEVKQNGEH